MLDRARQAAMRSVWHPEHVRTAATATAHANLALLFTLAQQHADAAPHFEALGDAPVEGMWGYYDAQPEVPFRTQRDLAAKAAAKAAGRRGTGVRA
jgi:hypothetical protein